MGIDGPKEFGEILEARAAGKDHAQFSPVPARIFL